MIKKKAFPGKLSQEIMDKRTDKLIASCTRGNARWSVLENEKEKYILCDVFDYVNPGKYITLEEKDFVYDNCPYAYIEMAPPKNPKWREKVIFRFKQRQIHQKINRLFNRKFTITVFLTKTRIKQALIERTYPIEARCLEDGFLYRVPPKNLLGFKAIKGDQVVEEMLEKIIDTE